MDHTIRRTILTAAVALDQAGGDDRAFRSLLVSLLQFTISFVVVHATPPVHKRWIKPTVGRTGNCRIGNKHSLPAAGTIEPPAIPRLVGDVDKSPDAAVRRGRASGGEKISKMPTGVL
jgi:hypothetical protein